MNRTSKTTWLGILAVLSLLLIAAAPAPAKIKIMPLGDSITSGNQDMNSYRRALWQQLQAAGYTNVVNFNTHIPALGASLSTTASPVIVVDQFTGITSSDMFDSWHPGPTGQTKMATKWFNALKPVLDKQPTAALPRVTASRSVRPGLSVSSIGYNIRGQVLHSKSSSASGRMIGSSGVVIKAAGPDRLLTVK